MEDRDEYEEGLHVGFRDALLYSLETIEALGLCNGFERLEAKIEELDKIIDSYDQP